MPEPFSASVPTRRDARAAPLGEGNPDKLGTEAEKSLAPRVEWHEVASGVRTDPQGRQAFRICPALLSTPWRLHIGYAYLSDTTLRMILRAKRALLILSMLAGLAPAAGAAEGSGVSPYAYRLTEVFGLPVTNAMITSWVFSLLIIFVFRLVAAKPKLIPTGPQVVVESLVEGIRDMISPIVGRHMVRPTFPLLVGFFTFILIQNWSGLLPGVGAFGIREGGHLTYFYRPANTDLNMTLALAIVSFVAWFYFILRYAGPKAIMYDLFGNKAEKNDVPVIMFYILMVIFFLVGFIEIISILLRLVSLSFRLYGNMFGGENLLTSIINMVTGAWYGILAIGVEDGFFVGMFKWMGRGIATIVPVPFYFLETLIGLVQALVFTLLVAVYIGLICNHGDEEHAH